jgi:argininosuccinate lyase
MNRSHGGSASVQDRRVEPELTGGSTVASQKISRERLESGPGPVYTETVLEPAFRFQLDHYFLPLVETNKAWTVMLEDAEIIEAATAAELVRAITALEAAGPDAVRPFDPDAEYFYSHVERYLTEQVGPEVAGEINIGRTRPEPLARLMFRELLLQVVEDLNDLRQVLLDLAEREAATVMPQWTHMQHAQVSTVGHYVVGIARALQRDHTRLIAAYGTVNESTLGCGALAGSSYPLDRRLVADLLGFDGFKENTNDSVGGGDWLQEAVAALANMMITLSRLSQDFYTWHTSEFGYIEIGDDFSGSSSMMPQKKNPYPFEYVRSMAARTVADMSATFQVLHNVNFQDTKDVEEEMVYPALAAFERSSAALRLLTGVVATLTVDADTMLARAREGFGTATELAATIHRQTPHLSYRDAHRLVGELVLRALKQGKSAVDVDDDLVDESARAVLGHGLDLEPGSVQAAMDPAGFVAAHDGPGGPAPREVVRAVASARTRLDEDGAEVAGRRDGLQQARQRLAQRVEDLAP